jgi:2'-5' RNA ligase
MKIFVVTADVELTHKPAWLDDFRARFDKPYKYHITLKQSCFIEEEKVQEIKNILNKLFTQATHNTIAINFDTLKISKDAPGGICIMIHTSSTEDIRKLQKQIANALSSYTNYVKPAYQNYEDNFEPHITIARDLNEEQYQEASKRLTQDHTCTGTVGKIILTVVNTFGPEEANDPKNQTLYNL